MTNWPNRFLELATFISSWSKDPSTKVGAIITRGNRIISTGFNGPPQKIHDLPERLLDREMKLRMVLHAEVNAILFAKQDLKDCTLYCTHPPCTQCAAMIIQSGLEEVIFPPLPSFAEAPKFYERWKTDIDLSMKLFSEANIIVSER
mgnify:FL=1